MNERRSFIERLFEADFMPHGHCFLCNPEVLWMHVISDAVTAVSYLSIPVALPRKRKTRPPYSSGAATMTSS